MNFIQIEFYFYVMNEFPEVSAGSLVPALPALRRAALRGPQADCGPRGAAASVLSSFKAPLPGRAAGLEWPGSPAT